MVTPSTLNQALTNFTLLGPPYGFGRHKAAVSEKKLEIFMLVGYLQK